MSKISTANANKLSDCMLAARFTGECHTCERVKYCKLPEALKGRLELHKIKLKKLLAKIDSAIYDADQTLQEYNKRKTDLEHCLKELEGDNGKEKV